MYSFSLFLFSLTQTPEDGYSRLKRWIMIGDHHQLPPVIKNMAFQKYSNMEQSLFTRFVRLGVPTIDLDAQGRARARSAASQDIVLQSALEACLCAYDDPFVLQAHAVFICSNQRKKSTTCSSRSLKWSLFEPALSEKILLSRPAASATCTTGATNTWATCLTSRSCQSSKFQTRAWPSTSSSLTWRTSMGWESRSPTLTSTRSVAIWKADISHD